MTTGLRQLVPVSLRHAVSRQLARRESGRLERELEELAAGAGPIVAGPWLGEVGFELLYWVPFLAWFAERFSVAPARLVIVSRGGTRSWYDPFANGYRDVLDYMTPEAFKSHHDARVREVGEQKQTRLTGFERELLALIAADAGARDAPVLHPSTMYRVLRPFWWGHVGPSWVHRHARYRVLAAPPRAAVPGLPDSYVAVKFYFNDCFPDTAANRAFARDTVAALAEKGPVVSLTATPGLDDHETCHHGAHVVSVGGGVPASTNLHVQSAVVANARAFVGTYGGFAYLAPLYGVRCTSYFSEPNRFARSHLLMAQSVLTELGAADLLEARQTCGAGL